jgi:uncharacterized protein YfaS (alpha-2-macroglobulin family)
MAAYAMALGGKPDAALAARLYAMRGGLPKWGQAFLLRALKLGNADATRIATLERNLVATVAVSGGRAVVHDDGAPGELERYMTSDVRATAMTLAALLDVDPRSPLVDPLAEGLLAARDAAGRWETTQDDLWSLVALAQYARRTTASGDATEIVAVGGKEVSKRRIHGGEIVSVRVPLDRTVGDRVSVTVDGGAHTSARVTSARVDAGAADAHGFSVSREYRGADGKTKTTFAAGELVTVALTIHADAAHRWVALVDALPAGFEVVNDKLVAATRVHDELVWEHRDVRDDRVAWFADELAAGDYALTYQARVTIAGTFTAMPAAIEAMYRPDVRGRSASARVVIAK